MLFLPRIYPEELFYSVCARFADIMDFPNHYSVQEALFGTRTIRSVVGFPRNLDHFVSRLPGSNSLTANQIIDQCTFVPIFRPFLPQDRLNRLLQGMLGREREQGVHNTLGLAGGQFRMPDYLRYCYQCVNEDREIGPGETFWRRAHQAPGVFVCPNHKTLLQDTHIPIVNSKAFLTAEYSIESPPHSNSEISNIDLLHHIAKEIQWLLKNPHIRFELQDLRERYAQILYNTGYANFSGSVRSKSLIYEVSKFYDPGTLTMLGSQINLSAKRNWVSFLPKFTYYQNPIRHILILNFLGLRLADLFQHKGADQPFGDGPWPCLNKVCSNYKQLTIRHIRLGISQRSGREPIATFECPDCGYTYRRVGPDTHPNDIFRGKVYSYGALWEHTLKELWPQKNITLKQKASTLGVWTGTVKRHAQRLGMTEGDSLEYRLPRSLPNIEEKRNEWIRLLEQEQTLGVAQLQVRFPNIYYPLYKYDIDWLNNHKPDPVGSRKGKSPQVDWGKCDLWLSSTVPQIAVKIGESSTKPTRVTVNSINDALSLSKSWLHKNLPKLPMTSRAIESLIESHEEFALRRVDFVFQRCKQRNIQLSISAFVKLAGLSSSVQTQKVMRLVARYVAALNSE